jgi:hypothetical protein
VGPNGPGNAQTATASAGRRRGVFLLACGAGTDGKRAVADQGRILNKLESTTVMTSTGRHYSTLAGFSPDFLRKQDSWFPPDRSMVARVAIRRPPSTVKGVIAMSKGLNSKKQTRKAPAKTMMEKRAAKKAKRAAKGTMR